MDDNHSKIAWLHSHAQEYLHQTIDAWPCGCVTLRMIVRPSSKIVTRLVNMCPEHQAMYDKSGSP